jgi:uncharacterized Zn finger protein (UPF0148 family)
LTLHIFYTHQCHKCGAFYIPYDKDVPCPNCGLVEKERFDYIPRATESLNFNLKEYGRYIPPAWYATMQRGTRAGPMSIFDRLRNARISRRRAPIERVFAVLKRVFRAGHILVTTVPRVKVKMLFSCLCFNLMQVLTLRRQVQV